MSERYKGYTTTDHKDWVLHEFKGLNIRLEMHQPRPQEDVLDPYFAITWKCDLRGGEGLRIIVDTISKLKQTHFPSDTRLEKLFEEIQEERDDFVTEFEPIWASFSNKELGEVISLTGLVPDSWSEDLLLLEEQMGTVIQWVSIGTPYVDFYYTPADNKRGSFGLTGIYSVPQQTVELFSKTSSDAKGVDLQKLEKDLAELTGQLGKLETL